MTQAYNLAILANAVDTSGRLNVGTNATGTLPVANGGTGASTLTANNVLLGNGTSALQAVAPGTNGNYLRSNGTTWVSQAGATGTVSSVATGNGLTGGTITTSGTLSVACPGFNTVGSYCFVAWYHNLYDPNVPSSGGNYAAGGANAQLRSGSFNTNDGFVEPGNATNDNLSGTWKWMAANGDNYPGYGIYSTRLVYGLACRVS